MKNDSPFREILRFLGRVLSTKHVVASKYLAPWRDQKNIVLSWAARFTRKLGIRAVITVGIGASVYSVLLYFADQIAHTSTSASHDRVLKARWASPKPSSNIVIVDIDERSLAMLAREYGRWPWPRAVLADAIVRMNDVGVRVVLMNVMLSDPDKNNPESDAVMAATAMMNSNIAYPIIRLNPINDADSRLKVLDLLAKTGDPIVGSPKTAAVILPMFDSMLERAGIANHKPDSDGAIRRYPFIWSDSGITMPSIVARTVQLAGYSLSAVPKEITLNWRNKHGRYQRISFSDFVTAKLEDTVSSTLKDSIVILGASAPGIGQTKGTAVSSIEDDNEILATALDDVISDTHLRVLPTEIVLLFELVGVWSLVWVAARGTISPILNLAFIGFQSCAASVTILSASYTNYLIDLTSPMAFGAGVFATIKLVQSLDSSWSRARPGYRRVAPPEHSTVILLVGYRDSRVSNLESSYLQRFVEREVGLSSVIRVDDLFGGESFARGICQDFSCQIVRSSNEEKSSLLAAIQTLPFIDKLNIRQMPIELIWNPEEPNFRNALIPNILRQCADLLES